MKIPSHVKDYAGWIGSFILGFLVLLSCNAAKQLSRKDQKALNHVNANAKLQDSVMKRWFENHPQDTSRKVIIIPGEVINVPVEILVRDLDSEQRIRDSILAENLTCEEKVKSAFDLAYDQAEEDYKANPVKVKCPPSTHTVEKDVSAIRRAEAATKEKELANAYLAGQSAEKDARIRSEEKKSKFCIIISTMLGGLLLLSVFFNIKTFIPSIIKKVKT